MGSNLRVLHLISSGGIYGAEKMVVSLARGLERMGCHSIAAVFDNGRAVSTEVANYMREQNIEVVGLPCKGRIDWTTVERIQSWTRAYDISLLHSHGYKADIYTYLAARKLRCPIIATSHFWTRRTAALCLYAYLDKLALRRFDYVSAVSEAIKNEILAFGVPPEKVCVLNNGIDLTPFHNPNPSLRAELGTDGMRIVGGVGRLVEQKGFDYLLSAIPTVVERFPKTMFVVAGEGTERARLEAMTSQLKIDAHVRFLGTRSDMPNVYASFDAFVLPSIDEGMPIALIEAMASAKPVVATRVAAVPRLITQNETGLLVPPRDPQALAEAICQLLANPVLCQRLSEAARTRVEEQFSAQAMAEGYLKMYHLLLPSPLPVSESALCRN